MLPNRRHLPRAAVPSPSSEADGQRGADSVAIDKLRIIKALARVVVFRRAH